MSAPVEMPVTMLKLGRRPVSLHPLSNPAPNAPCSPPPESARIEKSCPPFNAGKFATWGINTESGASAQVRTAGIPMGTAVSRSDSVYGVRCSAAVQWKTETATRTKTLKIRRRQEEFTVSASCHLSVKEEGSIHRHFYGPIFTRGILGSVDPTSLQFSTDNQRLTNDN